MRKYGIIILALTLLSGCATYKFHHGQDPYNKGYVVSRDDYTMLEYTLGKDNTVPKLDLAKERFKRRRDVVEDYYKRMGYIENRAKMTFWDPAAMFLKLMGGIFYLPVAAVNEYRYNHNPAYKAKVDKLEEENEAKEAMRIKELKEKLMAYVDKDLVKEESMPKAAGKEKPIAARKERKPKPPKKTKAPKKAPEKTASPAPEQEPLKEPASTAAPSAEAGREEPAASVQQPETTSQEVVAQTPPPAAALEQKVDDEQVADLTRDIVMAKTTPEKVEAALPGPDKPVAVIVADPVKGYSPLKVRLYGSKSYAPKGRRIVSYLWDFGDGDTSTRENPVNTFYSTSYQPRDYNVVLTVQDDAGQKSEISVTIEVLNK